MGVRSDNTNRNGSRSQSQNRLVNGHLQRWTNSDLNSGTLGPNPYKTAATTSGGVEVSSPTHKYHVFISPGFIRVGEDIADDAKTIEVLLIGGGGGGGNGTGAIGAGGGGAGGVVYIPDAGSITAQDYDVTVGYAGTGGLATPINPQNQLPADTWGSYGGDGGDTYSEMVPQIAGGGGGGKGNASQVPGGVPEADFKAAQSGASGGGGGGTGDNGGEGGVYNPTSANYPGSIPGQGNDGGGTGGSSFPGAGGGGYGGSGNAGSSGNGGNGGSNGTAPAFPAADIEPAIPAPVRPTWTPVVGPTGAYAGGGGGGGTTWSGGGGGSSSGGGAGAGGGGANVDPGVSAVDYTGSGGGGAGGNNGGSPAVKAGGDGSIGLFVVKYPV